MPRSTASRTSLISVSYHGWLACRQVYGVRRRIADVAQPLLNRSVHVRVYRAVQYEEFILHTSMAERGGCAGFC